MVIIKYQIVDHEKITLLEKIAINVKKIHLALNLDVLNVKLDLQETIAIYVHLVLQEKIVKLNVREVLLIHVMEKAHVKITHGPNPRSHQDQLNKHQ